MLALHYTSVKTPAEANKVYGLQIAIQDWVRAWLRYSTQEKFPILVSDRAAQDEILEIAKTTDPTRLMLLDQRAVKENFDQFDVIFRADPDTRRLLWQRQQLSPPGFSFCGLSHAMSGLEGGEVLEQYCLAPSQESDAIVCPSRAVAAAIKAFWTNYADYIEARFGAKFRCPVQLPVIPLGIDCDKFAARVTPEKRAAQRAKLNLSENDTVLLWVGRLSYAIKAHPLAMFQAAERAAQMTGASIHLVMQGYFLPEQAREQFADLAKDVCKKAKVTFIASDDARFPDGLWAAGDIFLSLVDNMQESFGLTPIEAMAAGLPRVLSDWDGYRDCVQNGEDGFLVNTITPPAGSGQDLSNLILNGREVYGGFLGKTALSTAVDHEMAAAAIKILIEDKNKRHSIIEKAKARVKNDYDWKNIIPAYEKLWKELAQKRSANKKSITWPLAPDPFTMYASYPSFQLMESNRLHVTADADTIRLLLSKYINVFGLDMMVDGETVPQIINRILAKDNTTIAEIFAHFPKTDRAQLWRSFAWLMKLGILRAS